MRLLPFKESATASIGTELEFQIIDPQTFGLASCSHKLLANITDKFNKARIKPEITQSMIELNTSIHHAPDEMLAELIELQNLLIELAKDLNVMFCGSGTHPFEQWITQKIYPAPRYENIAKIFSYLCQRATVFGQHVHVGCSSGDDAIYLTHALARYAPQFLAICAASPFYQGIDTKFYSSRATVFNGFPMSGMMPYILSWKEFSEYFYKLYDRKIIETMKDVYWDLRPKPEFGTVEVRVCDTPLSIKKAVQVAAYIQALSAYLLEQRPFKVSHDLYYLYGYNRFQATRYGFEGRFIDPENYQETTIYEDIMKTVKQIEHYANQFSSMPYVSQLVADLLNKRCDADLLRQIFGQKKSLPKMVEEQCKMWRAI